jgi:hypothetical protein
MMATAQSPKDCPPDGRLQRAKRILVPFSYRHGKCVQPNVPCKVREKVQRDTLRKKIDALKRLYVSAKVGSKTVITTLEEVDLLYTKYKLYEKFPSSGLQVRGLGRQREPRPLTRVSAPDRGLASSGGA